MDIQTLVRDFHEMFHIDIGTTPKIPKRATVVFRQHLIEEELDELREAVGNHDLVETMDALADIVYVAYGTAITYGVDLDQILAEVHRSNLTKVGPNLKPGKPTKGFSFEKPDILGRLLEQGYEKPFVLEQLSFDL